MMLGPRQAWTPHRACNQSEHSCPQPAGQHCPSPVLFSQCPLLPGPAKLSLSRTLPAEVTLLVWVRPGAVEVPFLEEKPPREQSPALQLTESPRHFSQAWIQLHLVPPPHLDSSVIQATNSLSGCL